MAYGKILIEAVEWYKKNSSTYESLSNKVEKLIKELLYNEQITYHSVISRTKFIESFRNKAEDYKYTAPKDQIKDLSGIRIIAYVESDVEKICTLIKKSFKIYPENSIDKSKDLGIDKVGYRAVHYVCEFTEDRCALPEFKNFKDLCFEIQVRTILQHAWAEIDHDRNYKFQGILPEHIKRRSVILAGVLELVDREFDSLSHKIDEYAKNVSENTKKGIFLNIKVNTTSLREYMNIRFKEEINKGLFNPSFGSSGPNGMQEEIIQELKNFGITTLDELDKIIPDDISDMLNEYEKRKENVPEYIEKENVPEYIEKYYENFTSILETFMMIKDLERYLEKSWKYRWKYIDDLTIHFISEYNNIPTSEILKIISNYDIEVVPYF